MPMTIWSIDVERVTVVGAQTRGLSEAQLRAAVEGAVRDALSGAELPRGRAVHAAVRVNAPAPADGAAIASAVARGVEQAVGGRARG
jgi:hypothetical protein